MWGIEKTLLREKLTKYLSLYRLWRPCSYARTLHFPLTASPTIRVKSLSHMTCTLQPIPSWFMSHAYNVTPYKVVIQCTVLHDRRGATNSLCVTLSVVCGYLSSVLIIVFADTESVNFAQRFCVGLTVAAGALQLWWKTNCIDNTTSSLAILPHFVHCTWRSSIHSAWFQKYSSTEYNCDANLIL